MTAIEYPNSEQDLLSGLAIAFVVHSVDPSLCTRLRDLLSHSLIGRLIPDEKGTERHEKHEHERKDKPMTRFICTVTLLLSLTALLYAQPVHMPDPNLRAAVRETLNLPDGSLITRDAMLQLTNLGVTDHDIADLTGLEFAKNLTWLALGYNPHNRS